MADIFEEVEEGLRQDKLSGLWSRYGIFAYLAAAVLIGGVALNEYLKVQNAQTIEDNASRLEAALSDLDSRDYETAATKLTAIIDEDIAPSNVAAHYLAGVRLEGNGDAVAAATVLEQAAGDVADPTEQLALIKAAYLRADTLSREDLEALMSPLLANDGPFSALAKELLAAKALQDGDVAFARREFTFLSVAPNVPRGVVTRAEQALAALPPMNIAEEAAPDPEQEETLQEEPEQEAPAQETPALPAEPASGDLTEETPE